MDNLANALSKYYKKQAGKILFNNNKSLNQLALLMWERLDFSQIDASVLSKVICGKRLFTPTQLEIFCNLLEIPPQEKTYLFFCLNKDYCRRNNIDLDTFFVSKLSVLELLIKFKNEVLVAERSVDFSEIIKISSVLDHFVKDLADSSMLLSHQRLINEILSANLYIKAKNLINSKHGSIYLAENNELKRVYASSPVLNKVFPRKSGKTMSVYIKQVPSTDTEDYITKIHPELKQLEIGSDLVVPFTYRNKSIGVLSFLSPRGVTFTKKDLRVVESLLQ